MSIRGLIPLMSIVLALGLSPSLSQAEDAEHWHPHSQPALITRQLTAFTRPVAEMQLASEISGRITTITAEAGDQLQGDGPVLRLESSRIDAAYEHAAAGVREAAAQKALARADQALSARELAWWEQELARVLTLVQENRAPAREGDEMRYRRDSAALSLEAAQQRVASAQAGHERAQAAYREAQAQRQHTQIHAPAGWLVAERLLEVGSVVAPGEPILHLVDVRQLELPLQLSAAELQALSDLQDIPVQMAGGQHQAQLHRIDPRFDPHTRKRKVWLRLDASQLEQAGGGMEARIQLQLPDQSGALRIPRRFAQLVMEQWLVEDVDGQQHHIQPLRSDDNWLVVDARALPADVVLRLPPARPE